MCAYSLISIRELESISVSFNLYRPTTIVMRY